MGTENGAECARESGGEAPAVAVEVLRGEAPSTPPQSGAVGAAKPAPASSMST